MIDLHMHSHYSEDGEYSPIELVEQCLVEKISVMSITDHNCVKANLEALALAKSKGMKYISGVEIDCVYKNTNFHVLGYGIDFQSNDFNIIEKNIEKQSFQASLERLEKTQILGFRVTENDMWDLSKNNYWQSSWSGEMFAEVLLANPDYKNHPLLNPYRPGGSRGDNPYVNFYWDYYSQGKPCYVNIDYPKMEQIIDTIQCNNGISVLAHPGVNLKNKNHLLDEIINLGIDGIEVFSNYHNPVETKYFYQKAKEKQLIITCGSDFHGKTKPFVKLGSHHCFISDDEIQYKLLK